jgi:hypothetical protein
MMSTDGAASQPFHPEQLVQQMMAWLDRWGLPQEPIPPIGDREIHVARAAAEQAAKAAGRLEALERLRRSIIEWAMNRYRQEGLKGIYFGGAPEPPEQRRTAIEVILDASTAYLLADVLPDETATTLLARFDVYLGGGIFPPEPAG